MQIEDAIQGAVDIAKYQYAILKSDSERTTQSAVKKMQEMDLRRPSPLAQKNIEELRQERNFFSLSLIDQSRNVVLSAENAAAGVDGFEEPPLDSKGVDKAFAGQKVELFEEKGAQNFIRNYVPLRTTRKNADEAIEYVVVTSLRINPELSEALGKVNDTFRDYSQTKLFKDTLRVGYLITLLLITAVTLFGAIWFGFYLSKQITTPIQQLASATVRIARGDYSTKIDTSGDDELSFLAKSFNNMIERLATTREEVGRRGAFIETILARLGVAVIAVDLDGNVTQINEASEKLFFSGTAPKLPEKLPVLLPPHVVKIIEPLLESVTNEKSHTIREAELSLTVASDEKKLVCTVGSLNDSGGTRLGSVILFDDITEITKAQSIAVWREVAQRIAHEIKNPLTPIRLSAQRLQKLLKTSEHSEIILECADTIVQNVDSIKRLANEFSNFCPYAYH